MRSRISRLGMVTAGLLALVGSMAPPAHAVTNFEAEFVGTATVASGLDSPCAETVSTGGGTLPCPPTPPAPKTVCLPLQDDIGPPTNCHTHYNHNLQGVTVASTANLCVGTATNVAKPTLPPVAGPLCDFIGNGHVSGWCGLSGGQVTGTIRFGGHPYNYSVHFTGAGGELVVTGHWTNPADGHHGLITGAVTAVPPTSTVTGQTCLAKTARDFQIVGTVVGTTSPNLL